ncbi:MAG TPA: S8 family serine peptidase, partial [Acidimicrobiia bacterium]|nr:S8 family serine peptidase [Acidimicrobiia bacterium]
VDTGTDLGHPDLAGQLVAGRNVLHPGAVPQDDNGHGTMVSGVIAARTSNGRGVVGVAPSAKVMPIKVLDSNGAGSDTDIALGIDWARTHGAKVINLSLGGTFDDPLLSDAVQNAVAANVLVVAAAGNDSAETVGFPAAYPGVVAVSATNNSGALTSFSSYGWRVDVAAPGLNITSTALGSKYATESGTSFSSPIVAGVGALLRSLHPTWTQTQVADRIRATARDVGLPGVDAAFGHGIVDPLAALGGLPSAPRPAARVGAGEPNDTPTDATTLTVGAASLFAQIAPETDEDWYTVHFAATGWYSVQVPAGGHAFDHAMDPLVELYNPDRTFAASQEFAGGDLVFNISATGDYLVRVRNINGSTANYSIVVHSTSAPSRFASALDVDFGTPAQSVGIADVNGDGRKDAVVAFGNNTAIPDTVAVFAQTQTRSLSLLAALPTDQIMAGGGMATGDLDGDGHSDVAIPVLGGIDYFTNIGVSTTPSFISRSGTSSLAIADVDGDTHNDIVAVGSFGAQVFWGPLFTTSSPIGQVNQPTSVAVGNVTGHVDNLLDVVTSGTVVYKQTSFHNFGVVATPNIANSSDVAVGNVSADALPDVVTSVRSSTGVVGRLIQDGVGGFTANTALSVAPKPQPIVVADVDAAAQDDIVTLHDFVASGSFAPASVGWMPQTAPGTFGAEQTFSVDDFSAGYDAKALAVGDIEGDGRADVLVATGFGIAILVQNSGVLPSLGAAWMTDAQPSSMATNVASGVVPTVTVGRDVTNVNGTTVELRDAAGNQVGASVAYNGATHVISITPNAALPNGRYAVHLSGLTDTGGDTLADAGTTFSVGPAPDEVAPQTTLIAPPSGFRSTAAASLGFSTNEPGSVFWCSDNNAPYHVCTSPQHVVARAGNHWFRVFARDAAGNEDPSPALATWTYRPPVHGYWMLGGAGAIYHFGNAPGLGDAATAHAVDFDVAKSGYGYWIVNSTGRVFGFGDAPSHGSAPALAAGDSVTSISRTATGNGYWLFTKKGRVYAFGDAHFYGDLRNVRLNGGVVDSIRTPSGHGYYMVATDGGVFSFGDAHFHGSTGNLKLAAPVRSLVPDPDGNGYWLVAVDGGVFAFDAPFRGSMGATRLNRAIVGMVAFGNGYLMVGADGGIFDFSTKPFYGSLGGHPPAIPIVSVAAFG